MGLNFFSGAGFCLCRWCFLKVIKAGDLAQFPLIAVSPDDTVSHVLDVMQMYSFSQIPVIEKKGEIVGSITERILLKHLGKEDKREEKLSMRIRECMDEPFPIVDADASLEDVYTLIVEEGYPAVLVRGKDSLGIISKIDVLRAIVLR